MEVGFSHWSTIEIWSAANAPPAGDATAACAAPGPLNTAGPARRTGPMSPSPEVTYRFNGRTVRAPSDSTLLDALPSGATSILQRSIRYHRPRGPACGLGFCTGCLVRVNGVPNVRSCLYIPKADDRITTENAWPSPRFDLFGILDVLFPNGIDTLQGFRRPRWVIPLYHRVVRRLAGYGRLPSTARGLPARTSTTTATETVIVGAGRAGQALARKLVARGSKVLLVDRSARVAKAPATDVRPGTTAAFLPAADPATESRFRLLTVGPGESAMIVKASTVVIATGSYDASLLFPGNDRPGVITADAAFALGATDRGPSFRRALLVGGGKRAGQLLDRFGEYIQAVAAPGPIDPEVARRAAELEVPLHPRTLVLGAGGRRRVRSVSLASRGGGAEFRIDCDAVILAHRRIPNGQLLFQSGAKMLWRTEPGAYFPQRGAGGTTTVPGLLVCGSVGGALAAQLDAEEVAHAYLGEPSPSSPTTPPAPSVPANDLDGYYRELFGRTLSGGKLVACACEDVLFHEVEDAARKGYRGIEVIKRYTSLGTGLCQGRYCLPDALLVLSILEGRNPSEVGYITQRPPVVPVSLGALATLERTEAAVAP
jgi:2Fe-2S iron-sulfur cluster protein/sarcosine oxidase alpha subunit family protein/pyridine nucleotide-disulfide oxidoreductase